MRFIFRLNVKRVLSVLFTVLSVEVLALVFWPFVKYYFAAEYPLGDEPLHFANVLLFQKFHAFPLSAWQGQWFAGYPLVEGYPWLHYYLIQPLVSLVGAATAMNFYSIGGLQ